mmetsp:Transcript_13791/g.38830  ORF Transcript_13791/g.38830 Transcript_13791/m.38830 type:complete len:203 (-) Transcript_13791:180-788(-)
MPSRSTFGCNRKAVSMRTKGQAHSSPIPISQRHLLVTDFSNFSSASPNKLSSRESAFKYTLLPDLATMSAMSRAASIRRSFMKPGFFLTAKPMSSADSASPLALVMIVFFSCWAPKTTYLAFSASCWATCLASTARAYSGEKLKCVMATSSNVTLNFAARRCKSIETSLDTCSRLVRSSLALYLATMALADSFMMLGKIRSS